MMNEKYIIALDQGTTSSKAILFDREYRLLDKEQKEIKQYYPKPGWVEHDPEELFSSSYQVISILLKRNMLDASQVKAIGITNHRETTIVWDRNTGKPIYNAIVWQCRRTADVCERIKKTELYEYIMQNTGLVTDAYFSATKIKWILDNVEGARKKAENGDLLFGTVDSWLLYKFTEGKVHATDCTNASRTMIYNIKEFCWDKKLLSEFNIPYCMLPEVRHSGEIFGRTNLYGKEILIAAMAGDQQASLFGQTCFNRGDVKNTYGTGCFMLVNIGSNLVISRNGMITTIAADLDGCKNYAMEGSIFTGGSVVQWLRDEMGLIVSSSDSEDYAYRVKDTNGVSFVPAFTGLGAPYWDMDARGTLFGITRGTNKYHIVRAALESIAYQCRDVLDAIIKDTSIKPAELKVDGGASSNNFLMQFQSDIMDMPISRPEITETTGFGAAALAGLATGFYASKEEMKNKYSISKRYIPNMSKEQRDSLLLNWVSSVKHVSEIYRGE